jgi:DNA polymerase-3 subunit delta
MPVYKRQDIPKLLDAIAQGTAAQVYLVIGERYLNRSAAGELIDRLLPEKESQATNLHQIDGDREDVNRTLNLLKSFSLFTGRQVFRVTDTKLFYSKGVARNLWDKACEKNEAEEPGQALHCLLQMLSLAAVSPREMAEEGIESLSSVRWQALFGFSRPEESLSWAQNLLAGLAPEAAAGKGTKGDVTTQYTEAFEAGIPPNNILFLLAETVDKRKRFYKYIQQHGVILDLAVDPGSSKAARKDQDAVLKELLHSTLAEFGKKIEPQAVTVFLERVGFHPVAVVMEAEKLALYVGDQPRITREDVDAVIGRTREEALFELTEAVTTGKIETGLRILAHLQAGGVHPLAILATLRNHFKKLLIVRALQGLPTPAYSKSFSFSVFQKKYLPQLKEGREEWHGLLWKGHPYALYMLFRQAARFSCSDLQEVLREVLTAEYRMKGSPLDNRLVMDNLLFNLVHYEAAQGPRP